MMSQSGAYIIGQEGGAIMSTSRALSRDEIREVDRRAIEEFAVPGVVLMENAGRGAAELLMELGIGGPVVICAGRGNNAGDGFVIARHLEIHGYVVRVVLFSEPAGLSADAATNWRILERAGTPHEVWSATRDPSDLVRTLDEADWVVDALLGTGLRGPVRDPFAGVIEAINQTDARVLAVDVPSGLDCDTGQPLGTCVEADHTATFVARKLGFEAPGAERFVGTVHVLDIGAPRAALPW